MIERKSSHHTAIRQTVSLSSHEEMKRETKYSVEYSVSGSSAKGSDTKPTGLIAVLNLLARTEPKIPTPADTQPTKSEEGKENGSGQKQNR